MEPVRSKHGADVLQSLFRPCRLPLRLQLFLCFLAYFCKTIYFCYENPPVRAAYRRLRRRTPGRKHLRTM